MFTEELGIMITPIVTLGVIYWMSGFEIALLMGIGLLIGVLGTLDLKQ